MNQSSSKEASSRTSTGRHKGAAISLRLYVAGQTPNSERARVNLDAVLASVGGGPVDLETIDVLGDPRRAMADNVFVTPTLLGLGPNKPRVIFGDLSDSDLVRSFVRGLMETE